MRIRKSKRQSAWEFMRRNQTFSIGDVMMITQMKEESMRLFLRQLVRAAKVKCLSKRNVALKKKRYLVLDARCVVCPVNSQGGNHET